MARKRGSATPHRLNPGRITVLRVTDEANRGVLTGARCCSGNGQMPKDFVRKQQVGKSGDSVIAGA